MSGNLTQPSLPNMIVVKGDVRNKLWNYLPVKYLNIHNNKPRCNGWIEKPVYLLQARYRWVDRRWVVSWERSNCNAGANAAALVR